jgi:hypothetical protein
MRTFGYLTICFFLISCQGRQDKKRIDFVSKVENLGLDKFKNIEYGTRGDLEYYHYCFSNDSSINWSYNPKSREFQFPLKHQDFKLIANDSSKYIQALRKDIHSVNVVMITQSPWIGNIVRFWITDNEIISYVNPDFKFDDRFKNEWMKEIKSGYKFKDNWYYIKIKKTHYNIDNKGHL